MLPPLLYVVSREADTVNGWRFDANLWNRPCLLPKSIVSLASNCARN
jgi:hypothetical protein